MTLSDLSIKKPVFAWMLMIGILVFGILGLSRLGISLLPDVNFPVVMINIGWEGADPETMETEVADVIEDAVMTVPDVRDISSVSKQGQTTVTINFNLGRDIDAAIQDVQSRLAQAAQYLPKDINPPLVRKINPENEPILWIVFSGDRPFRELLDYTRNHLKDRFSTVPGAGDVSLAGYIEPNLRVWLDAKKMRRWQMTVADVIDAVRSGHAKASAGRLEDENRETSIKVLGEAGSAEELQNIIISRRGGTTNWKNVRIGEVARVEEGVADARRIGRVWGNPTIALGIRKQSGANAVQVARAARERMEEIKKTLPPDMRLDVVIDTTDFVKESTQELLFMLLLSAALTSLVAWLFLGSWSSTLNVILSIPVSVMGTFLVLNILGFTLNIFTVLGLTLAIGIVVDDAIMVLENIVRHREAGASRVHAALAGAREITFAALASSAAILAVFLPVVFMEGIVGKFFFQFGVTLSVAVMLSLLEALTLAPMRCSQFLEVGHETRIGRFMDRWMGRTSAGYRLLLERALRHRWKVVMGAAVVFLASLAIAGILRKELSPAQDQGEILARLRTPVGSSLEFTDKVFKKAETWLMGRPEVETYITIIGGIGGMEDGDVNDGFIFVKLKPRGKRRVSQQEFMASARRELGGLSGAQRLVLQEMSLNFTAEQNMPVEFTIRGPEWERLGKFSEELMARMSRTGLMTDVSSDFQTGMPEVQVIPDRKKAAERGVDIRAITEAIGASFGGIRAGKYARGGRRYDIRVRLTPEDRQKIPDITKLTVRNDQGELVLLSELVKTVQKTAPLSITRKNRERAVTVSANAAPGKSQGEALAAVEKAAKELLPEGYHIVPGESAKVFRESFIGLAFALVLGIFVAYMVLASQFNSFLHPFTVLLALPFSVTGAFLALWLGGQSLNIYSLMGIILLMGIVKKNSILLVDFANQRRKLGLEVREALLEAGPIRLRPIIMTSVATIAAAIPPALALGPGAETRIPMALVIIGGVTVSTFFTLFVVPCAYSLLSGLESHRHDDALREALTELGETGGDGNRDRTRISLEESA